MLTGSAATNNLPYLWGRVKLAELTQIREKTYSRQDTVAIYVPSKPWIADNGSMRPPGTVKWEGHVSSVVLYWFSSNKRVAQSGQT